MIHIDIKKIEPEQAWKDKATKLLTKLTALKGNKKKRNKFIDENSKTWTTLKKSMVLASYGKCWYSETRDKYSYYHVDHFRPKKKVINYDGSERDGYWWLSFIWENYRLLGAVGNTFKGNHFAVKSNMCNSYDEEHDDEVIYLLDPIEKDDVNMVTFNEMGEIIPSNPDTKQWANIKATYTIEKMNLNFDRLQTARHVKWKHVKNMIDEVDILEKKYNQRPSAKKKTELKLKLEDVRKLLAPCEELSSTVRACLRASRKTWAVLLLEENLDPNEYCSDYIIPEEKEN